MIGQNTANKILKIGAGIQFETGLSWPTIVAKAKREQKHIFVDCYATWCEPCKWMDANVFSQEGVGDSINAHFISVKVQMDKTAHDSPAIQNWYIQAESLKNEFQVNAFPTYLIFSPDGQPVHKMRGAKTSMAFLNEVIKALDAKNQNYVVLKNWKSHTTDSSYLFTALIAALTLENDDCSNVASAYLGLLKKPYTKENIRLFDQLVRSSKDWMFTLYLKDRALIDSAMRKPNYSEYILSKIIFSEEYEPLILNGKPVYWKRLVDIAKQKYPELSDKFPKLVSDVFEAKMRSELKKHLEENGSVMVHWKKTHKWFMNKFPNYKYADLSYLQAKIEYCAKNKLFEEEAKTATYVVDRYSNALAFQNINMLVWDHVFNVTGDKRLLSVCQQRLQPLVAKVQDVEIFDTYANLLYKNGYLQDALIWENKAIDLARQTRSRYINEYITTLEKMKKGQRTWEDGTPVPDKSLL